MILRYIHLMIFPFIQQYNFFLIHSLERLCLGFPKRLSSCRWHFEGDSERDRGRRDEENREQMVQAGPTMPGQLSAQDLIEQPQPRQLLGPIPHRRHRFLIGSLHLRRHIPLQAQTSFMGLERLNLAKNPDHFQEVWPKRPQLSYLQKGLYQWKGCEHNQCGCTK